MQGAPPTPGTPPLGVAAAAGGAQFFNAQPSQAIPPTGPVQGPVANVVRYDYAGENPSDMSSHERSGRVKNNEEAIDLVGFRRQYADFQSIKYDEMNEQRDALAFYDGAHWTSEELKKLADRGQPDIVFNRIDKKLDGVVGVIQRLRGDPKCFGRNQPDEQGAEVATQCIRYCLDASRWVAAESEALLRALCMGYAVAELVMVPGDKGDPDLEVAAVDQTSFFYDPRSLKLDFSDCRFMGISKLCTRDEFEELWPDKWEESVGSLDAIGYTIFDTDKSYLWSQGRTKIRVVEHWYRMRGDWHFCFYAGDTVLQSGLSPFFDEKGKTVSRFIAFAIKIDAAGDHYGYVRTLKGPQRALNYHRAKSVHIMNTRQLIVRRGALGGDEDADVEDIRRESARPDGVIVWDGPPENQPQFSSADQEFLKQAQFYQEAKQELDSWGPSNQAMLASLSQNPDISNRVFNAQQQAGLAELGQFLTQWRNWRQKIYRLIWVQQQRNWTAERVLRVTSDQGLAQYVQVNAVRTDQWGRPVLVNQLGNIDVDIIADEGPDTVNVMGSVNDILVVMAQQKIPIPPQVLIETSPLPASKKRELIGMLSQAQQPQPQAQAAQQALLQNKQADTQKKQADAMQSRAGAIHRLAMSHHEVQKAQATERGTAMDSMTGMRSHDSDLMDQLLNAAAGGPGGAPPTPSGLPGGGGAPPAPGGPPGAGGPPPASPAGLPMPGPPGAASGGPPLAAGGPPPIPMPPPGMPPGGPPMGPGGPIGALPMPPPGFQRPVPGGPPLPAPDGELYVHAPHPGGLYRRVRRR
jgi:hypothetical protein